MLKLSILSVIVLGSATLSVYTGAGSSTSTMNVSVSVEHSCSIESSPMAFGAYNGVMANASIALEAKSTVVSTCTSGAGALVTINAGASAGSGSAGAPLRRMTAGEGHYLVYQVYSDVARGSIWGNTAPTGVALTGTGGPQTLTAYGSVPAAQPAASGVYSDQLGVTITY
jgi:spore coat protein U-like protein